jgi:hypothetical protein
MASTSADDMLVYDVPFSLLVDDVSGMISDAGNMLHA